MKFSLMKFNYLLINNYKLFNYKKLYIYFNLIFNKIK